MIKKLFFCIALGLYAPTTLSRFPFDLRRAQRRIRAHTIKSAVSNFDELKIIPIQNVNGDEQRYSDKRGNFNKVLKHQSNCFPDTAAFASLVRALDSGTQSAFNSILLGGARRLVNPQASFYFSLAANDGWINAISAAPAFASAESAGEMVEDYWSVLLRDVTFADFGSNATATMAIADLNNLSDFRGPKINGSVTAGTLFRGVSPGSLTGIYISQFLYKPIPCGAFTITQQIMYPDNTDFMTTLADYKTIINGGSSGSITYSGSRYIITPRDLTEYVHKDFPSTAATNAALLLNSYGDAALDRSNPYLNNSTQEGFVSFGLNELLALVQEAANEGLKAAWYHKWQVHRRLRPEEFGFYLTEQLVNGVDLGINSDLTGSAVLPLIFAANTDNYLLAQAYPEGSPAHPAYPAGHATFIGATVTILKAWFDESFVIPDPVQPSADGSTLDMYMDGDLLVGDELNKLAENICIGRNLAGVHYRSDGWQGMLLGEQVAIDLLNNISFLFNEQFSGFSLTTFEGRKITVGARRVL